MSSDKTNLNPNEYVMNNYMELCVAELAPKILATTGACTCDNCLLDISAVALNNLPPKYVVSKRGELFTRLAMLQHQFDVDIVAQLSKAAEIVAKKPRHDV